MCGILVVSGSNIPEKIIFKKALNALKHRGPDAQLFSSPTPNLILGHTRLSIVDIDNELGQEISSDVPKDNFSNQKEET